MMWHVTAYIALLACVVAVPCFGKLKPCNASDIQVWENTNDTELCYFSCKSEPKLEEHVQPGFNNESFAITTIGGGNYTIILRQQFDREKTGAVTKLNYNCDRITTEVLVQLMGVDDNPLEVIITQPKDLHITINENDQVGKHLFAFSLSDADKPQSNKPDVFHIAGSFASHVTCTSVDRAKTCKLNETVDYDNSSMPHTSNLTLTVTDGNKTVTNGLTVFTVIITDFDDQSPAFTSKMYNCSVSEGDWNKRNIGKCTCTPRIEASDQDKGINANIDYKILSVFPSSPSFSISQDGTLNVNGTLDREKVSSYILGLKAYQANRPSDRFAFASAVIIVEDIDDNQPTMSADSYTASVMENSPRGTLVLQVSATDPDEGDNAKFEFQLLDSAQAFKINRTTGVINVEDSSKLDRENMTIFTLKVWAKSITNSTVTSGNSTVTIDILDENDNSPVFQPNQNQVDISIYKDHKKDLNIYEFNVSDADSGDNGRLTVHLEQPREGQFGITNHSVYLNETLMADFKRNYTITLWVIAEDQAVRPRRRSTTQVIVVHVNDKNINKPQFCPGNKNFSILESAPVGTILTTFCVRMANDKDPSDVLTFNINHGNDDGTFEIKNRTLKTAKLLDREVIEEFNLTVVVSDSIHKDSITVSIKVLDVNDNNPVFGNATGYSFEVSEEKANVFLGNINATDSDTGSNAKIQYALIDDRSGTFIINNGALFLKESVDRERLGDGNPIELTVTATDGGKIPRQTSVKVLVTVMDVNDNAPQFDFDRVNYTFPEGSIPKFFHTAKAVDPDEGNNGVIKYKTNNTNFTVENGKISATNPLQISNSAETEIILIITAGNVVNYSSSSIQDGIQTVAITVKDVNNKSPVFTNSSFTTIRLFENTTTGTTIARFLAEDGDLSPLYNTVTYWLSENASGVFSIDPRAGKLRLVSPLDYDESPGNNTLYFMVYASDLVPNNGSVVNVSVIVVAMIEDINDNAPEFDKDNYNCSIKENFKGAVNCLFIVTDKDSSENGNVALTMETSNKDMFRLFRINGSWDINLNRKLDYEKDKRVYNITLKATDNGIPQQHSYRTVMIYLLNENDNQPKFVGSSYKFSVRENNTIGHILAKLTAYDADDGDLTFRILGNGSDLVTVSASPGSNASNTEVLLLAKTSFDFEAFQSVNIMLKVSDGKYNNSCMVTFNVEPVNEFNPRLTQQTYQWTIEEESTKQWNVAADDLDTGDDGEIKLTATIPERWKDHINIVDSGKKTATINAHGIDRDVMGTSDTIQFVIVATDQGHPPRSDEAIVYISVEGINDHAPTYSEENKHVHITREEGRVYSNFFTSEATDSDIGCCGNISYTLASTKNGVFAVHKNNGTIYTNKPIRLEKRSDQRINLTVIAYNTESYVRNASKNGTQFIEVTVKDINDKSPVFKNQSGTMIHVPENTTTGAIITRFFAEDDDISPLYNTVTYWLSDNVRNVFSIDPRSGELRLISTLDYDESISDNVLNFTVYASDLVPNIGSVLNVSLPVVVMVEDINDNAPEFAKENYNCSIKENFKGAMNCLFVVTDKDSSENGNVTVAIDTSNQGMFSLSRVSGAWEINLNRELDYEKDKRVYNITLIATDNGIPQKHSYRTVMIYLLNENDNQPKFVGTPYKFSVRENNTLGHILAKVTAYDADDDDLNFRVLGNGSDLVTMSVPLGSSASNTEVLLLANTSFDFEAFQSVNIMLRVSDGEHNNSCMVTFNVESVNEFNPRLTQQTYQWTIEEESTKQWNVAADDLDTGDDGEITLTATIPERWKDHIHIVDSGKKTATINVSSIDRDVMGTSDTIQFVIVATDEGHPPRSDEAIVYIRVDGINDNAPRYSEENKNVAVTLEEGKMYSNFFTSEATDVDQGCCRDIKYSLNSTLHEGLFGIYENNGTIYTNYPIHLRNKTDQRIYIRVIAYNEESYEGNSIKDGEQSIILTVKDVNDKLPVFRRHSLPYINEDTAIGTIITNVSATDDDIDSKNKRIVYWLNSTSSEMPFTIDFQTGKIMLMRKLDFDPPNNETFFNLTVYATDLPHIDYSSNHTQSTSLLVYVRDVNDNRPLFANESYIFHIDVNAHGLTSHCVSATDRDSKSNITYNLINTDSKKVFDQTSGCLKVVGNLQKEEYQLNITASDNDNNPSPLNSWGLIKVFVINHPPVIEHIDHPFQIRENNNIGDVIGRIIATDDDDPTGHSLIFKLNTTRECNITGNGNIRANIIFDRESHSVVNLMVIVSDGMHEIKTPIEIDILDENDNQPVFGNTTYEYFLDENKRLDITNISASDLDHGDNGNITYSLKWTGFPWLQLNVSIDSITGHIHIMPLDREQLPGNGVVSFLIVAMDHGTAPHSSEATVKVNVIDVNDNAPYFVVAGRPVKDFPLNATVYENTNTSLLQVYAVDRDETADSSFTFSVTPDDSGRFYFRGNVLYTSGLDREAQQKPYHILNISVFDGKFTETAEVNITIIDVNDNSPCFHDVTESIVINDIAPKGTNVATLSVSDADPSNKGFTFILSGGQGYLGINTSTGEISVISEWVTYRQYNLTVTVFDHGDPPRDNKTKITVVVNETNECPPSFKENANFKTGKIEETVPENKANISFQLNATDCDHGDAGKLHYTIVQGNQSIFHIDEGSGAVSLLQELDYESKSSYQFVVRVVDSAKYPKTASATVYVTVEDQNDKPAILLPQEVYVEVNAKAGTQVTKVQVQDNDTSPNFTNYTYEIYPVVLAEKDLFRITASGEIVTTDVIQVAGNYRLNITVHDDQFAVSTPLNVIVSNITVYDRQAQVTENEPEGTYVFNVSEVAPSGTLRFSLYPGFYSDFFNVSSKGVVVTTKPIDREVNRQFYLRIKGTSSKENITEAEIKLHVTILDVNDKTPVFDKPYWKDVWENSIVGTSILQISASDADENPQLSYSMVTKTDLFTVDRNGTITVNGIIDRDTKPPTSNITLQVVCNDTQHTASTHVYIHVLDENDNPPVFSNKTLKLTVNETVPVGYEIAQVTATDIDTNGTLEYSISSGNRTYFKIGKETGVVQLTKRFDVKETKLSITVKANDSFHCVEKMITIFVKDVNDHSPVFRNTPFTFNVDEGPSSVGKTFEVKALDDDAGNNGRIKFSLTGIDMTIFNISTADKNTGVIRILKELDVDKGTSQYNFHVLATDQGTPKRSSSALVTVTVVNINDRAPEFTENNYTKFVQEAAPVGYIFATITATDPDDRYTENKTDISYKLSGTGSDDFNITSNGDILLNKKVSLATQNYNLHISATDGVNTGMASLTVIVLDTNDKDPHFNQSKYIFHVPESNSSNRNVGTVYATDDDVGINGEVTYAISSSDEKHLFSISEAGMIKTIAALDREARANYTFHVSAIDKATEGRRTGNCEVVIIIDDVNDNWPVFSSTSYTGSVTENTNTTVPLIPRLKATDKDNGLNGTAGIVYSLLPDTEQFSIDQETGEVICNPLDRERKELYFLQVVATDEKGKGLSSSTNLTITVVDLNDVAPRFDQDQYDFQVPENSNASTVVGKLTVSDSDKSGNSSVRFRILTGDDGRFYMDGGTIYVTGGLDRETKDIYDLNVTAFDGKNRNWTTVHVTVKDKNDNAPTFNETNIVVPLLENHRPKLWHSISAYDLDQPGTENSQITFFMNASETGGYFNVSENGTLIVLKSVDREKNSIFYFTVYAADNGIPRLSSSVSVTVRVLDENDNAPVFYDYSTLANMSEVNSYIVEQSPKGSVIAFPVANDADFEANGTIHYMLQGPVALTSYFHINNRTGLITLAKTVDLLNLAYLGFLDSNGTNNASISLTVLAKDGGPGRGRNSSITLNIFIEAINDNAPRFVDALPRLTVVENSPTGTSFGKMIANEPNATHVHLTYLILQTQGNDAVKIEPETGTLLTSKPLDRERQDHFVFAVQVKDQRTPERSAYAAVDLRVLDVNDNSPKFSLPFYTFDIAENENDVTPLRISASDLDLGNNGTVSYQLMDSFGDTFIINETSGEIRLNKTLDREERANYTVTVMARDSGTVPRNASVQVIINVLDENDNSPTFVAGNTSYSFSENIDGQHFDVKAVDEDKDLNGTVIYSLQGQDADMFYIDPFNGTVTSLGAFDYEEKSEYMISIHAVDLGEPPRQSSLNVTIHVLDDYDYHPKCGKSLYQAQISTTSTLNRNIITVNAGKGSLYYNITGGDKGNYFSIDSKSGNLSVAKQLDRHTKQHILYVTATDHRTLENTTCSVVIMVSDYVVTFAKREYSLSISENLQVDGKIVLIDLNSTEELEGYHVTYSIVQIIPQVQRVFGVVPDTGVVYCNRTLDREVTSVYEIYVSAIRKAMRRKRDLPELSDTNVVKLVLHINDANDHAPVFSNFQRSVISVPGDAQINYLVDTLSATDEDTGVNSQIKYFAVAGDTDIFSVGRDTGEVRTLTKMDSTAKNNFTLVVVATDENGKGLNTTLTLTLLKTIDRISLKIGISQADFKSSEQAIVSNMSQILGVDVQVEQVLPHIEASGGVRTYDLSSSDVFFNGINRTTNTVVPYSVMHNLIISKLPELRELFSSKDIEVVTVRIKRGVSPAEMTATQITLICLSVFIFIISALAIGLAQHSWTRYETATEWDRKHMEADFEYRDTIELDTLQSRQSSKLTPVSAINPAYSETQFVTRKVSTRTPERQKKTTTDYETQEMRMNFDAEFLPGDFHSESQKTGFIIANSRDSGVENESANSNSGSHPDYEGSQSCSSSTVDIHSGPVHRRDLTKEDIVGDDMTISPRVLRIDERTQGIYHSSQSLEERRSTPLNDRSIDLTDFDTGETTDENFELEINDVDIGPEIADSENVTALEQIPSSTITVQAEVNSDNNSANSIDIVTVQDKEHNPRGQNETSDTHEDSNTESEHAAGKHLDPCVDESAIANDRASTQEDSGEQSDQADQDMVTAF